MFAMETRTKKKRRLLADSVIKQMKSYGVNHGAQLLGIKLHTISLSDRECRNWVFDWHPSVLHWIQEVANKHGGVDAQSLTFATWWNGMFISSRREPRERAAAFQRALDDAPVSLVHTHSVVP